MDNFDALFENGKSEAQRMTTEEYAEMKKAERTELYEKMDGMADKVLSEPSALHNYLSMQAKLGRTSVANTLLVLAQKPEATYVADFETWKEKGRSVKRNENGIKVFEQNGEFTRDDGSVGLSYNVRRVFDVSQTRGRQPQPRATLTMPLKEKIKALMKNTPVTVRPSEQVSESVGALYSAEDNTIYVARTNDWNKLFFVVARELARAEGHEDTFICDCAANITCERFGVPQKNSDAIPNDIAEMEPREKRAILSDAHEAASNTIERVDGLLYAELQKQKSQPER